MSDLPEKLGEFEAQLSVEFEPSRHIPDTWASLTLKAPLRYKGAIIQAPSEQAFVGGFYFKDEADFQARLPAELHQDLQEKLEAKVTGDIRSHAEGRFPLLLWRDYRLKFSPEYDTAAFHHKMPVMVPLVLGSKLSYDFSELDWYLDRLAARPALPKEIAELVLEDMRGRIPLDAKDTLSVTFQVSPDSEEDFAAPDYPFVHGHVHLPIARVSQEAGYDWRYLQVWRNGPFDGHNAYCQESEYWGWLFAREGEHDLDLELDKRKTALPADRTAHYGLYKKQGGQYIPVLNPVCSYEDLPASFSLLEPGEGGLYLLRGPQEKRLAQFGYDPNTYAQDEELAREYGLSQLRLDWALGHLTLDPTQAPAKARRWLAAVQKDEL